MGAFDLKLGAINRQLLDLLSDQAPVALLVNLLVPVLASIPLVHEVPATILLTWCAALTIVALVRFFLIRKAIGVNPEGDETGIRWMGSYLLCTSLQGMVWGVGAVVLLSYTSGFNQTLILLLVAGVGAGAIPMLGAMISAYNGFLFTSMLPVVTWLASKGDVQYWVLSAFGCVFMFVCYVGAKRFNTILSQTFVSSEETTRMLDELSSSNEKLEDNIKRHRRVEKNLRDRARLEQVVTTLSAGFVRLTVDEIDNGIDRALAKIGSFSHADRCYIYMFEEGENAGKISHQWSARQVDPRKPDDFHQLKYAMSCINKGHGSYVRSLAKLPNDATAERNMFVREKLKSWFAVPLIMDGEVRGFMGFETLNSEIQWNQDIIALLRVSGATLMNALERKRVEGMMQHQAHHDPLTALPNRRLFVEHIHRTYQECKRAGTKAAVLFLDVDYFKHVNDSLGHAAGDLLLKQIAMRLHSGLRREDIASRFGGDEFVVLLSDVSEEGSEPEQLTFSLAQRVQNSLSEPYLIQGQEMKITTSMGVALFPTADTMPENIIANADAAMYRAKDSGRNVIQFFEQDIQHKSKARLQMHQDLCDALERNEFSFYVQSQLNAHGDVITDELLLRWNSPSRGVITPKDFIPLAEDTGLIAQLDEWVLNNACRLIKQKKSVDHENSITYAINVSAMQFHRREFEKLVKSALDATGLSGGFLEIELTEGVLMRDQENLVMKMRRLKNMGVRIAVDDFGLGYSSLAFLKQLPIDKIKIDMSFVHGADRNPNDAAIVEAIVSIARNFELEVVAEGVESYAQLEFLLGQGVGLFQGHYFGDPEPIEVN